MKKNSILLYKGRPCILIDFEKDKLIIELEDEKKKIREKDATLLVEASDGSSCSRNLCINDILVAPIPSFDVEEIIELIEGEQLYFEQLLSLFFPNLELCAYYNAWKAISSSPFFIAESPDQKIRVRSRQEVEELKQKQAEKIRLQDEATAFASVLKQLLNKKTEGNKQSEVNVDLSRFLPFFTDLEEIALGKKETLKLLQNMRVTKENAHRILLKTGYWPLEKNPYPQRYNKIIPQAKEMLVKREDKSFIDLTYLKSYAIDNEETEDPDDAISYDGKHLWIHIALVADSIEPDSEYEKMLQMRGCSLYLPDGIHYMLGKKDTQEFALGLHCPSSALSIKIKLNDEETGYRSANIEDVEIFRTKINVERLSYSQATTLQTEPQLKPFFEIAKANLEKRKKLGSISIDIPHVDVRLVDGKVHLIPQIEDDAFRMIKEMMLLAGEAAAFFAFKHALPFQYISQVPPSNIPKNTLAGLTGAFQQRRYLKARSVSTTPAYHAGLGLSMYSQITSPMRRYGDLISQKQLLSFIDGLPCLDSDELFAKIALSDLSLKDAKMAERATIKHFVLVYLLRNPSWQGEALIVGMQQDGSKRAQIFIEELGLEALLQTQTAIGEKVNVRVLDIDLATLEVAFKQIS